MDDLEPQSAHGWLREQVDCGVWALEDAVGALTSVATVFGESGDHRGLGDFQLATAAQVFGLERLFGELSSQLDRATQLSEDPLSTEPTRSNRIQHALQVLKKTRAEQSPGTGSAKGSTEQ